MEVTALGIFLAILPGLGIAAMVWIGLQWFGKGSAGALAFLVGIGLICLGCSLGVATDMLDRAITVGTAGMVLGFGGLSTA